MTDRMFTDPKTGEVTPAEPRPFDQILRELSEGSTLSELSETMYDVIQRVQETSKAGSVTLTVQVGFDGQGRIAMKDEIKKKLPEFNRSETRFFVDKTGNASRRDPNQPALPSLDDARTRREADNA